MTIQNIFTSQTPAFPDEADATLTVGVTFQSAVDGNVLGVRWYAPTNTISTSPIGALWDIAGNLLASQAYGAITPAAWNVVMFAAPVPITAGVLYVAGTGPVSRYTATGNVFVAPVTNGDLTAVQDQSPGTPINGRFNNSGLFAFPTQTFGHNNYFADVLFEAGDAIAPDSVSDPITFGAPTLAWSGAIAPDSVTDPIVFGTPTVQQQSPLGFDPFRAVGETLLECLCDSAALLGLDAPAECCFRVGLEVAHDLGLSQDLCCAGLGYVAMGDVYPSTDSFPEQDIVRQANSKCGIFGWAVEYRIGLIRCVPVGDEVEGPTCVEWTGAALRNFRDSQVLRRAICCFLERVRFDDTYLNGLLVGMSVVVNRQTQGEPQGGCVERYVTIDIQIPNCEGC